MRVKNGDNYLAIVAGFFYVIFFCDVCITMDAPIFTQSELFELLTAPKNWYEGYCSYDSSRQIKTMHRRGKLSQNTYDEIFLHFGYTKHTTWTNPNNS